LGKTIRPLLNLNVYPSVRSDNVAKVVVDDDFVGDDVEMETHVFGVQHGGIEVETGKVDAQKLSPWGADGEIDEEFGHGEISRWCAFVAWIVNAIATNSEPYAMNVQLGDEKICVSARDVSNTLEKLPKFVCKTVCPNVLVFVHFHQVSIFKDVACIIDNDGINEVNGGVRG
jgi:hypothetical protein